MEFKDQLPSQGSLVSLAQKLSIRQKFEASVIGSPFATVALQQYEKELGPLVAEGRADVEFVGLVSQYWSSMTAVADQIQNFIEQARECSKTYPRQANLFKLLTQWAETAAKSTMQADSAQDSSYELHQRCIELEFALGQCQILAYRWSAYARWKSAHHMGNTRFASRLTRSSMADADWVLHMQTETTKRLEAVFWMPGGDGGKQASERFLTICNDMGHLIADEVPLRMLDWRIWIISKSAVVTGSYVEALEMRKFLKWTVDEVEEDIQRGRNKLYAQIDDELDQLLESHKRNSARHERARSEHLQRETVSQLVREQQLARQLAEGKWGAALVTTFAGTHAGAGYEGGGR